ncbi:MULTISPECIES: hypothetical protein [Idiomarina]|uniref:hypothetical protein n=1 Tax=Idiomarina TaxID=135575 RepID=UPI00129C2EE5|nr:MULTISPECIES: hypothetical protein [Idiomarina]MRJ43272.1 hypothetical protein [Idiomarina sp. FeN1]NCU58778.1 hypothetical protein [Idiomarina sp. FenA--70]NCU61484.1 hypothetical protein [Idiomarina sp. FenBw--71]UUN14339.1 hypothetical protein KGF88_03735 [Idiomarina loihiensis]
MKYLKNCVFNPTVLLYAMCQIIRKGYITFLIIAVPAYFMAPEIEFKIMYFLIASFVILVFTLLVCFILKLYDLSSTGEWKSFYALPPKERGIAIGDVI